MRISMTSSAPAGSLPVSGRSSSSMTGAGLVNSRSSNPRSLVRVWCSRACRERESATRGAGGRHPCDFESPEDSEFVRSDPFAELRGEKLGRVATRSQVLFSSMRPAWSNCVTAGTTGSARNPAIGAGSDSSAGCCQASGCCAVTGAGASSGASSRASNVATEAGDSVWRLSRRGSGALSGARTGDAGSAGGLACRSRASASCSYCSWYSLR